jgi:hypothetical protein
MNNDGTYAVLLTGIAQGIDRQQCALKLATAFRVSPAAIEAIMVRIPYALKTGLDPSSAEKYRKVIESTGATCWIERETLEIDIPAPPASSERVPIAAHVKPHSVAADSQPASVAAGRSAAEKVPPRARTPVLWAIRFGEAGLLLIGLYGAYLGYQQLNSRFSSDPDTVTAGTRAAKSGVATPARTELTEHERRLIGNVRSTPTVAVIGAEFEVAPGVSLTAKSNQYGEKVECQFHFTGRLERDGQELPPKWGMMFLAEAGTAPILMARSFHGTPEPLRMYFDRKTDFLPLKISPDGFGVAPFKDGWAAGLRQSRVVVIDHGQGANGPIRVVYDLSAFESVERLAAALCLS